ncbi:hypothetical protein [Wolbachia pipientis]|uniref:hypothetical protein n=1 Tax=Wolbachia pipientis TaxID=955 RepID=UPI0020B7B948|nr:hypothetical protein [Wolbachia pipientis]
MRLDAFLEEWWKFDRDDLLKRHFDNRLMIMEGQTGKADSQTVIEVSILDVRNILSSSKGCKILLDTLKKCPNIYKNISRNPWLRNYLAHGDRLRDVVLDMSYILKEDAIMLVREGGSVIGYTNLVVSSNFQNTKDINRLLKSKYSPDLLKLLIKNKDDGYLKQIRNTIVLKAKAYKRDKSKYEEIIKLLNNRIGDVSTSMESKRTFLQLSNFIAGNFPDTLVDSVSQGSYLPSFKARFIEINGRCTSVTRTFSQFMFLQSLSYQLLLNNLQTSAEVYERIAQGKQISKREEKEIFALSKLLNSFEQQLYLSTSSLPLNLTHIRSYKTIGELSDYVSGIKGDFAIHLVISNHVVAIYKTGDHYAYFDTNVAFVSGMRTIQELMKVVENAVKLEGYELAKEGLLVEHFDVSKANSQLSNEDKQILSKEIRTERQLLAEQDKKSGLIKVNGCELSRVQLYDFGTKVNVEGSVPLLINADMNLNSTNLSDYLNTGKISMTAREYIDNLKYSKNVKEVTQATRSIPFIGSESEIDKAEQTRKFTLFKPLLELYNKCFFTALHSISAFSSRSNRRVSQREGELSETTSAIENKPVTCLTDLKVDNQLEKSLSSF